MRRITTEEAAITVETARLLFFIIVPVMGLIWLLGTRFALARTRRPPGEDDRYDRGDAPESLGEVAVEGTRDQISRKIAARLAAAAPPGGTAFMRIVAATPERVEFERVRGVGARRGQTQGMVYFDRGAFHLTPEGARTRVRLDVELTRFRRTMRLVAYLVCFLYGGLFVVGVPLLVWHLAVTSDVPEHRTQAFQTVQMVHGVWPPFLIGGVTSRILKGTRAYFEAFLQNLQFGE